MCMCSVCVSYKSFLPRSVNWGGGGGGGGGGLSATVSKLLSIQLNQCILDHSCNSIKNLYSELLNLDCLVMHNMSFNFRGLWHLIVNVHPGQGAPGSFVNIN